MEYQEIFRRREIKYMLDTQSYVSVTELLRENGMKIDHWGKSLICSLYFDTPTYRLIRTSMEKPVYKEKLRLRTYGVPNAESAAFAEIKKKYKGIVYKRRVMLPYGKALAWLSEAGAEGDGTQIGREIDYFKQYYAQLYGAAALYYDRVAYYSDIDGGLRVTFDENIRYRFTDTDLRVGDTGSPLTEQGQYLMEIKIPGGMPLWMARGLSEMGIFPTSYSKYANAYKREILNIR